MRSSSLRVQTTQPMIPKPPRHMSLLVRSPVPAYRIYGAEKKHGIAVLCTSHSLHAVEYMNIISMRNMWRPIVIPSTNHTRDLRDFVVTQPMRASYPHFFNVNCRYGHI